MVSTADRMALKALNLINSRGLTATWRVRVIDAEDEEAGTVTEHFDNVAIKITPPEIVTLRYIDNELVRAGDLVAYIAAEGLAFTPKISDHLILDGEEFLVINTGKIYGGPSSSGLNKLVLWKVFVRR